VKKVELRHHKPRDPKDLGPAGKTVVDALNRLVAAGKVTTIPAISVSRRKQAKKDLNELKDKIKKELKGDEASRQTIDRVIADCRADPTIIGLPGLSKDKSEVVRGQGQSVRGQNSDD
jgi:hypothetical protein